MNERKNSFTANLIALMKEKNMTVAKAAQIAGISTSKLQSWRAGSAPTDFEAVKKLAHAMNVSFEFLLTGRDSPNENNGGSITEVFEDGGSLFDGYAKISIQRLLPRGKGKL